MHRAFSQELGGHWTTVVLLTFSDRYVFSGDAKGEIVQWCRQTGGIIRQIAPFESAIKCMQVIRNRLFAASSAVGQIVWMDLQTRETDWLNTQPDSNSWPKENCNIFDICELAGLVVAFGSKVQNAQELVMLMWDVGSLTLQEQNISWKAETQEPRPKVAYASADEVIVVHGTAIPQITTKCASTELQLGWCKSRQHNAQIAAIDYLTQHLKAGNCFYGI